MHVTNAQSQAIKNIVTSKEYLAVPASGFDQCPIRAILGRIGDRWTLLTVLTLGRAEQTRFNELRQHIEGISQRMLTLTLRTLEQDGFVLRTAYAEVPPRVEYSLTATGRSLLEAILALSDWANAHAAALNS